ncbi:MAG: HupE/UreJ family protein [Maricaulis sp.]|nr:HupE/UreJ family protein [Maricaulis sp.]
MLARSLLISMVLIIILFSPGANAQEMMGLENIVDQQTAWDIILLYIGIGFQHILPLGLDHILFVVALCLAVERLKPLIWQISAFTIAHTLTLGLASLGLVNVSPNLVEPIIALSIAWLALENLRGGSPPRWRPVLVFGFGLFHGLGFAGALTELGMPPDQFLPSLLAFNVGVELGQLSIVASLWLGLHFLRDQPRFELGKKVVSGSIALAALWWVVERIFLGG